MGKKRKTYSDSEILREAASGNIDGAFEEIYAKYSSKIFLYCRKVMDDDLAAEDIFQEVFLKFLDILKKKPEIDNLVGYLLKIARNLCLNHRRSQRVTFTSLDEHNIPHMDNTVDSRELAQLITTSLDLLPFEHKEAFVLQVYEGLSYKEIAEITDVPVSTVRNRVVRAKSKLRKILKPYQEYKR